MTAHRTIVSPPVCPMMGVQIRDPGDGYHSTVRWVPCKCRRDGCALWTSIGCGLSHGTTFDAEALAAARQSKEADNG